MSHTSERFQARARWRNRRNQLLADRNRAMHAAQYIDDFSQYAERRDQINVAYRKAIADLGPEPE